VKSEMKKTQVEVTDELNRRAKKERADAHDLECSSRDSLACDAPFVVACCSSRVPTIMMLHVVNCTPHAARRILSRAACSVHHAACIVRAAWCRLVVSSSGAVSHCGAISQYGIRLQHGIPLLYGIPLRHSILQRHSIVQRHGIVQRRGILQRRDISQRNAIAMRHAIALRHGIGWPAKRLCLGTLSVRFRSRWP
jgi:hypothetical protein